MNDARMPTRLGGTVIVTGGGGVVGSRVVGILRGRGVTVVAWDRDGVRTPKDAVVELTDSAAVRAAMSDVLERLPAPYTFVMAHGAHELNTLTDLARGDLGESVVAGNFTSVVNIVASAVAMNAPASRFVLLGSIAARTPIAFSAIYSASKSAAEVFLEAAGYELDLLGHSWCVVDVGGINTGFNEIGHAAGTGPTAVRTSFVRVADRIHSRHGLSAELVAKRLADIVVATRIRHQYTIGLKANVASGVARLVGVRGRRLLVSAALLRPDVAMRREG